MSPAASRPAQSSTAPSAAVHTAGRLLEETGWWLLLVTLVLFAVASGAAPGQVGLVLAAWFLLRPVMVADGRQVHPALGYGGLVLGVLAVLALNFLDLVDGFELILVVAVAVGGARALALSRSARPLDQRVDRQARAVTANSVAGWLGMAIGSAVAVAAHTVVPVFFALAIAAVVVLIGFTAARTALVGSAVAPTPVGQGIAGSTGTARPGAAFSPLVRSSVTTHRAAALAAGALFVGLIAMLPFAGQSAAGEPQLVGAGLALVGVGGLAVRVLAVRGVLLPLRQRIPPVLLVSGAVLALAVLVGVFALAGPWLVALPGLLGVGGLAALLQDEHALRARQAGSAGRSVVRALLVAAAVGQLGGALVVALLGSEPAAIGGPLVVLAAGAAVMMVGALALDRSSIFALRHQVQQFSWNARPEPRPFEDAPARTRPARLAGWIGRQVELELVDVTLPVSGRRYAIARPSGDGRDRLFEEAKADPERQMPYWAKVWPSGVALADVVVERAEEIRGRQVLELGAGLGVTACAVLDAGGSVITADYSLLPLGLCRLNGLANTGRAPGSICFNWRDDEQVREVLRRHPPIGLILAADVLYEGRDVMPLVHVIERLLAPGGSLWLAEPVRRTAHRFLDTVGATGWSIDSRRIHAEWPDATDGWVNVHIIQREREPTQAAIGLGAFQL